MPSAQTSPEGTVSDKCQNTEKKYSITLVKAMSNQFQTLLIKHIIYIS